MMKRRLAHYTDYIMTLFLAAGIVGGVLIFLPASLWIKVYSTEVGNAHKGAMVKVVVDRAINRDFHGEYSVKLLALNTGLPECWASAQIPYSKAKRTTSTVNLDWWGEGEPNACKSANLPAGSYIMTTCWTVKEPLGFLLDKRTCTSSNVFEITDPDLNHGGRLFVSRATKY